MGGDTKPTQQSCKNNITPTVDVFEDLSNAQQVEIFQYSFATAWTERYHHIKEKHPTLLNDYVNNLCAQFRLLEQNKETFYNSKFVSSNLELIAHLQAYHKQKENNKEVKSFVEYYQQQFANVKQSSDAELNTLLKTNREIKQAIQKLADVFAAQESNTRPERKSQAYYLKKIFSQIKEMGLSHLLRTNVMSTINALVNEHIQAQQANHQKSQLTDSTNLPRTKMIRFFSFRSLQKQEALNASSAPTNTASSSPISSTLSVH